MSFDSYGHWTGHDRYETGWSAVKHYDTIDKREVLGR